MTYEPESLLKPHYKKYKNRSYTLDELTEFRKFSNPIQLNIENCKLLNSKAFKSEIVAYEIGENSGFYYIPNPFNGDVLMQLIVDSLMKWPTTINRMNLDIEQDRPNDIWKATIEELGNCKKLSETWLYKLRWTSMGYHYQWTDRIYKKNCRSNIPDNLSVVMKDIISLLNWKEFIPEATIVNYYHLNSAMCFHQDHAEFAKDVPLVSMSLGQPAVYLLGTSDPLSVPIPINLNHGDVVVMSGKSRLAYHAVPKIIKIEEEMLADQILGTDVEGVVKHLIEMTGSEEAADIIWRYIQCSRININMRQVVDTGEEFPN